MSELPRHYGIRDAIPTLNVRRLGWLLGLSALVCFVPSAPARRGQEASKAQETNKAETSYPGSVDSSLYVGTEVCKTCHEDMPKPGFFKHYEDSVHFVTTMDTKRGPEWHGCEACHGPGKEHVDGGGDKTKIFTFKNASAKEVSARCLACHQYGEEHANFGRSAHLQNNIGCTDCHDPHYPKQEEHLLKGAQPQLCYSCHHEIRPQFNRPFHHRVEEGLMKCDDCHNPHGGFLSRQLQATASQDVVCLKCHTDKQGPFVYEHQPVKIEGCVSCHVPHGSSNPRLLKRSQVNLLCLECHSLTLDTGAPATPTFHNQAQKYQACTLCHVAIHGSNTSNVFFKP
jgi:DmsE family decaheme c-type cytochrome